MFSKILQIVPLLAILGVAQSHDLESRQDFQYGESSSYYQGCYSSKGGDVVEVGTAKYQSSGNCATPCKGEGKPVFAVSGFYCWCADLLPALGSQVDESMCSTPCPGIDLETCGGTGYFSVYTNELAGGVLPPRVSSGNTGGESTSSRTSSSSSTSSSVTRTVPKPTHSPATTPQSRPHRHTDKHSPPHTHQKPKTTPVSSTTVYKPMPSSSSSQSSAAQETSRPSQSSPSSSTGKIVGIVVGVVGGIVVFAGIIAGAMFYVRRRRRMKNAENGHRRADSLNAFVASGAHMPGSLAGRMQTPSIAINDARLDPWVMKETRRESGSSFLADSQDYSRRILKVTNPDSS